MALPVGSKAPDFTLKSKTADGLKDVKLSDNFGKKNTLVLFFPLAFTGVCTPEMCDISGGLNSYSDLNADVIGVSVDSPFAQEAWATKEKIGVTLASDLNKTTATNYDVLLDDLVGLGASPRGRRSSSIKKVSSNTASRRRRRRICRISRRSKRSSAN